MISLLNSLLNLYCNVWLKICRVKDMVMYLPTDSELCWLVRVKDHKQFTSFIRSHKLFLWLGIIFATNALLYTLIWFVDPVLSVFSVLELMFLLIMLVYWGIEVYRRTYLIKHAITERIAYELDPNES